MTRRTLWVSLAALVLAAIVATAVIQHFREPDFAEDIVRSQQLDTAHVARKDSSAKVDSAIANLELPRKKALDAGDRALDAANKTHTEADTLGQHAQTVRDSLSMWRSRDSAHVVENDSLRRKIHEDSTVIRSDSLQKILLTRDRDDWKLHSDSVVTAMDQLRTDLKKARANQCRIVPFVPCPSRKEAFVGGLVLGGLGGLAVAYPAQARRILTLGR